MDIFIKLWQFHLEFSALLLVILVARQCLMRTLQRHRAYLFWCCLPLAIVVSIMAANIQILQPQMVEAVKVVQTTKSILPYVSDSPSVSVEQSAVSSVRDALALVWVFGVALLLARLVLQHIQLRKMLRQVACSHEVAVSSALPIQTIKASELTPAVYGFFRPTIYLPIHIIESLTTQQLELIIKHEEEHVRQAHPWLNLLWDILVCVLWFNPLMYLARQQFRHDQELYCDYLVLRQKNVAQTKSYGHALLSTVSATHSLSLLCSWNTFNSLEERIMTIKQHYSNKQTTTALFLASLIIVFSALFSINATGGESKELEKIKIEKYGETNKYEIQKDGKHWLEVNGERYALVDGKKVELTDEENVVFDQEIAKIDQRVLDKHTDKKVIVINADGDKEFNFASVHDLASDIEIEHDGVALVDRNGERYALEDGKRRSLTSEEQERIETEVAKVKDMMDKTQVFNLVGDIDIEGIIGEHGLDQHDVKIIRKQLSSNMPDMDRVQRELERAQRKLEQSRRVGEISERRYAKAKKEIAGAQAKLERQQKSLEKELAEVRSQLAKMEAKLSEATPR